MHGMRNIQLTNDHVWILIGIAHASSSCLKWQSWVNSVPARLGKGQGAKEIGHNPAREQPKFGHNLVRERHIIGHSLERE